MVDFNKLIRFSIIVAHDILMIPLAWLIACGIRYEPYTILHLLTEQNLRILPAALLIQSSFFWAYGLYRGMWRFASLPDLVRIIKASFTGSAIIYLFFLYQGHAKAPLLSMVLFYCMSLIFLLGGSRLCYRWLKDYRYFFQPKKRVIILGAGIAGEALARNISLSPKSGYKVVAFLDDDDVWTKDTVRPHIAIMDADPGIAAAFGQIAYVTPDLKPVGQPWPETAPSADRLLVAMLSGYFPQIGATVVKASVARAIGLMDEELLFAQDWDWQLRIARAHRIAFVNQTCVLSRIRALGSFDDIQMLRTKYIARIFRKHALPEFRRWNTPRSFLRAYIAVNSHIYDYFIWTAVDRAKQGNRRGARQAIYRAFRINPVRATKMLKNAEVSGAIKTSFGLARFTQKS